MTKKQSFTLDAAGYVDELSFAKSELDEVHLPIVASLFQLAQKYRRLIVLLTGPSGTGKTTLAALWGQLAAGRKQAPSFCVLPMDGFHLPHKTLEEKKVSVHGREESLARFKGAPETFDLELLRHKIEGLAHDEEVKWPRYDRILHDPVPDAIQVPTSGIIIVEGLYLLLDRPGWRDLRSYAHWGIFVEVPEDLAQARVVARHMRGGRTRESAEQHWKRSDAVNTQLVNAYRHGIDVLLKRDTSGRLLSSAKNASAQFRTLLTAKPKAKGASD